MVVSIQDFRTKAFSGDADRLELNSAGTGLHRKGLSAGGKAVEWLRDAMGLRKAENQNVMTGFVASLRAEYGERIGAKLDARLADAVGAGKPLSSRTVRLVLEDAEQLRAGQQLHNRALARDYSEPHPGGKVNGYMSAALAAHQATGVSDEVAQRLFDAADPKVVALGKTIADKITAAASGDKVRVTTADAQAIAQREMARFLTAEANSQAVDSVLGAGNPDSAFQQKVAAAARALGAPELAAALADSGRPEHAAFKQTITTVLRNVSPDQPTSPNDIRARAEILLGQFMAGLVVDSGGIRQMQQLPDDPALAMSFAKGALGRVFGDKEPGLAGERPALADLLHREIGRLRTSGDPAGIRLAGALSTELERVYTKITDPAVKVGVLERARDGLLEEARAGGPDAAFYKAAAYQNDIIALHLRGLGEPATAQHADTLETLAQRSPALAKAMDELDQIEREYVASKGGDPDTVRLGWREGRQQLAGIREAARGLAGEATGSELQAFIATKMRGLTADLLANATRVLGPPPGDVPFVAISLGSASRGEASPFSDVEFAILLDRPATPAVKDYMRNLAEVVRFQVGNLGENAGLETPAGFHWDTGTLTPAESPDEFIGSADELIDKNLRDQEIGGKVGPSAMFGLTMFTTAEHLYSPKGGDTDWAMVKDLQQKATAHFAGTSDADPAQTRAQTMGTWMVGEAAAVGDLRDAADADAVDVKKLSRFPMLLAQGLAMKHGIATDEGGNATNSTLMRLDALAAAGVLTRPEAETLKDAFVTLGRVRVEAHLHADEGDDTVSLLPAPADGRFAAPEVRDVINALLPFVDRVERLAQDPTRPF